MAKAILTHAAVPPPPALLNEAVARLELDRAIPHYLDALGLAPHAARPDRVGAPGLDMAFAPPPDIAIFSPLGRGGTTTHGGITIVVRMLSRSLVNQARGWSW